MVRSLTIKLSREAHEKGYERQNFAATKRSCFADNARHAAIRCIQHLEERTSAKFCQSSCLLREVVARVIKKAAIVLEDEKGRDAEEAMALKGLSAKSVVADIILRSFGEAKYKNLDAVPAE